MAPAAEKRGLDRQIHWVNRRPDQTAQPSRKIAALFSVSLTRQCHGIDRGIAMVFVLACHLWQQGNFDGLASVRPAGALLEPLHHRWEAPTCSSVP